MELWDYCCDFWIMVTTQVVLCIAKLSSLVESSFRIMGHEIMGLLDFGIMGSQDFGIVESWDCGYNTS